MLEPIVFYDIPSNSKNVAWSPNTWKTRYTLNVKGLPYKTVWVEYPDIARLCDKLGPDATWVGRSGIPIGTLPIIYDPNTRRIVPESAAIARYLDRTYPDTPAVIPRETEVLVKAFQSAVYAAFADGFGRLIVPAAHRVLRAASQPFFRSTREEDYKATLEELAPEGSAQREEYWKQIEQGFRQIEVWYEADGSSRLLVMGDERGVSFADFIVAGWCVWCRECFGEGSEEWGRIKQWNGGRWAKLLAKMEQYSFVDQGEDLQL
ncbi:uncharacterized protein BXZ73DRAFT_79228 [Epithele typhae]|uniref:uncharacterized protein n=1 Tax=Epithele typhae TaxID=378194 RepID=UPI0020075EAC|nr:uncharacterized protein BXZ73DRAFT_79228 [Epithele typhae]KAH9924678.1 hypothetical protein BXZ73DRAFT_79228 [Epithele typhae]